jgi:hypothetical protein
MSSDDGSGAGGRVTKLQELSSPSQRLIAIHVINLVIIGSRIPEAMLKIQERNEQIY